MRYTVVPAASLILASTSPSGAGPSGLPGRVVLLGQRLGQSRDALPTLCGQQRHQSRLLGGALRSGRADMPDALLSSGIRVR